MEIIKLYLGDKPILLTSVVDNHNITKMYLGGPDIVQYAITCTVVGLNGTASPSGTTNVNAGLSFTLTMSPVTGYKIELLEDNGTDVTTAISGNTYQLTNINLNHNITILFGPHMQTVYVISSNNSLGTVSKSPNMTQYPYGSSLTVTLTETTNGQFVRWEKQSGPGTWGPYTTATASYTVNALGLDVELRLVFQLKEWTYDIDSYTGDGVFLGTYNNTYPWSTTVSNTIALSIPDRNTTTYNMKFEDVVVEINTDSGYIVVSGTYESTTNWTLTVNRPSTPRIIYGDITFYYRVQTKITWVNPTGGTINGQYNNGSAWVSFNSGAFIDSATLVRFTYSLSSQYVFDSWTRIDGSTTSTPQLTFNMPTTNGTILLNLTNSPTWTVTVNAVLGLSYSINGTAGINTLSGLLNNSTVTIVASDFNTKTANFVSWGTGLPSGAVQYTDLQPVLEFNITSNVTITPTSLPYKNFTFATSIGLAQSEISIEDTKTFETTNSNAIGVTCDDKGYYWYIAADGVYCFLQAESKQRYKRWSKPSNLQGDPVGIHFCPRTKYMIAVWKNGIACTKNYWLTATSSIINYTNLLYKQEGGLLAFINGSTGIMQICVFGCASSDDFLNVTLNLSSTAYNNINPLDCTMSIESNRSTDLKAIIHVYDKTSSFVVSFSTKTSSATVTLSSIINKAGYSTLILYEDSLYNYLDCVSYKSSGRISIFEDGSSSTSTSLNGDPAYSLTNRYRYIYDRYLICWKPTLSLTLLHTYPTSSLTTGYKGLNGVIGNWTTTSITSSALYDVLTGYTNILF